ncbi:SDR family NAD(P)-dependent oxidoreductase [Pantoea ananatis]|uniref:SDR family NAD(P)-dependent oxidoreductase n=1 Tax=Pantoea ananas TaxID=553 RepID=UPI001B305F65|nr:glucose 1-dehydrogenase [Pantoea ananatis]
MLFDLKGKTAIVTGASSGLGEQFARALVRQGADVAIIARRKDRLDMLAIELRKQGGECLVIECDLKDEQNIINATSYITEKFHKIDILVNNAGISEFSAGLNDHTSEQWDKVLNINLKSIFLMSREVSKVMMKQKSGRIINIASIGSHQAGPSQISYHAAKSGVTGLTKAMAADLAPYNITVNAIAPGIFRTEINQAVLDSEAANAYKSRIPLKRFGHSGELDGALVYLASDASSYTNAEIITVDGGMTAML